MDIGHGGLGWSCRGEMGQVRVRWSGVSHAGGGVGHAGVGWVIQGWLVLNVNIFQFKFSLLQEIITCRVLIIH